MSMEISCRMPKMEIEDGKMKRTTNESIMIEDATNDDLIQMIEKYKHSFDLKIAISLKEPK